MLTFYLLKVLLKVIRCIIAFVTSSLVCKQIAVLLSLSFAIISQYRLLFYLTFDEVQLKKKSMYPGKDIAKMLLI